MTDPFLNGDAQKTQSDAQNSAKESVPPAGTKIVVPENLHLHISLEGVPESVSALFQKLAKPASESKLRTIVRDYLPALTPVASAVIAFLIAYYGGKFENRLTRDTLDKIATEFVEKNGDPQIAAMKLSAYGDEALPAVRMVLASNADDLRGGGELIVQQMYLQKTVKRRVLVKEMMRDYNNPVLQQAVLEWLDKMGLQLQEEDRACALKTMRDSDQGLGANGQNCAKAPDDKLAYATATVLLKWSAASSVQFLRDAGNLAFGLAEGCTDAQQPQKFDRAKKTAVNALARMAESLPQGERRAIAARLAKLSPSASPGLRAVIDNASTEIQNVQGP